VSVILVLLLNYFFQISKAAATDILDGVKMFSIVMAPKMARAVHLSDSIPDLANYVQTKEDNRKNNAQKQESINRGKAAGKIVKA
jgi:hypothetical protein